MKHVKLFEEHIKLDEYDDDFSDKLKSLKSIDLSTGNRLDRLRALGKIKNALEPLSEDEEFKKLLDTQQTIKYSGGIIDGFSFDITIRKS